jgi:hypothetical protein
LSSADRKAEGPCIKIRTEHPRDKGTVSIWD